MVTHLGAPTDALEIQAVEVGDPGANQVRIAVESFCLDFNDIDTIRGRYGLLKFEPPFVIGMAAAGTVEATGPGCEGLLGRRVVGTTAGVQGAYASVALLEGAMLQQLPSWLSAAEGVAMYFPYQVSYLALRVRGRIAPGDVVLVHAAAGGVGSAAVQLAKAFGATVIGTAGTDEKVEFCRSLGADFGVNYRAEDFVAVVDDVTNGRGVDVAFDTVGGAVTTDTFRAMAFNGRHLIIGFASGIEAEERPLPIQPQHLRELRSRRDLLRLRRLAAAGSSLRNELPVHRTGNRNLEPHLAPRQGRNDPPRDRATDRVHRRSRRPRSARASRNDRPHRCAHAARR